MQRTSLVAQQKKRLLGHWRSDAKKTLKELALRTDISGKQLRFFRMLFGRLEVEYRSSTIVSGFAGESKKSFAYKVLGADADSLVISWHRKQPANLRGPQIQQIHFEGEFYWITLGGGSREFFKRIDPQFPPLQKFDLPASLKKSFGSRKSATDMRLLKKTAKPL